MISTPRDMLKYAKPLGTGQLISAAAQLERTKWLDTAFYPPGKPFTDQKYGFALADVDGLIGHGGNIQGYDTFLAYLPAVDASIVVISTLYLTNDPGWQPRPCQADRHTSSLRTILKRCRAACPHPGPCAVWSAKPR